MNKLLVALSAAALLVSAGAAYAAEASGTIKAIDAAKKTVTLQDGMVFMLPASVDVSKLKVGEAVKITYETKDQVNTASMVAPK
ncbi:MAG TPA: DUF1344 domain-containing protein [Kiloniellales bacterium]